MITTLMQHNLQLVIYQATSDKLKINCEGNNKNLQTMVNIIFKTVFKNFI